MGNSVESVGLESALWEAPAMYLLVEVMQQLRWQAHGRQVRRSVGVIVWKVWGWRVRCGRRQRCARWWKLSSSCAGSHMAGR